MKYINEAVWLRRKKTRMTKICICSLTVYFLLGKSGIKATFMHTEQMFMISSYLTSPSWPWMALWWGEHLRMSHVYINREHASHDTEARVLHFPF